MPIGVLPEDLCINVPCKSAVTVKAVDITDRLWDRVRSLLIIDSSRDGLFLLIYFYFMEISRESRLTFIRRLFLLLGTESVFLPGGPGGHVTTAFGHDPPRPPPRDTSPAESQPRKVRTRRCFPRKCDYPVVAAA